MSSVTLPPPVWADDRTDRTAIAQFMARTIGKDPRYVSHGEVQTGLSLDGKHWAKDLEALLIEDLREADPDRSLLVQYDANDAIVGAAIILWQQTARASYAVLEDIAVGPEARSTGVGDRMYQAIEREAKSRGMRWMFLESGKENHGAHRFFEQRGFAPLSTVFGKPID